MKYLLSVFFVSVFFLSGCSLMQPTGYNRQSQPADPNQALLQILQQKTLERTVNGWNAPDKCESHLEQLKVQQIQISKIINILRKEKEPIVEKRAVLEYEVPPLQSLPDFPIINFEYGEVENNS